MSFTNYDGNKEVKEPRVLTIAEKKALTDDFIADKTVTEVKHERFIPSNLIKSSFAKKKAIENYCTKLMRCQVKVSEAEYDEEGNITKEAEYNVQPSTSDELKTEAFKQFPDCDEEAFDYNVDKIIETATSEGTFAEYKKALEE